MVCLVDADARFRIRKAALTDVDVAFSSRASLVGNSIATPNGTSFVAHGLTNGAFGTVLTPSPTSGVWSRATIDSFYIGTVSTNTTVSSLLVCLNGVVVVFAKVDGLGVEEFNILRIGACG